MDQTNCQPETQTDHVDQTNCQPETQTDCVDQTDCQPETQTDRMDQTDCQPETQTDRVDHVWKIFCRLFIARIFIWVNIVIEFSISGYSPTRYFSRKFAVFPITMCRALDYSISNNRILVHGSPWSLLYMHLPHYPHALSILTLSVTDCPALALLLGLHSSMQLFVRTLLPVECAYAIICNNTAACRTCICSYDRWSNCMHRYKNRI